MVRKKSIFLCMALMTMVLTGCRSLQGTTAPQSEERPEAIESDYTVMTFTGTVEGISVNGQVRMEHGRTIWCSVSKMLELGRAMATPDSVWVRMPMLGQSEEGTYKDLERRTGQRVDFNELEAILESEDAEARIAALARRLGVQAQVKITRREKVKNLTFPFYK